ncbi:unnamed protein product [Rotaria socialis]|uniref:Uncharacterized protein n=1 Tax=Rotaria socialis TaxID=392032 RepID=A0A820Q2B4_9BILA|nr:unnamed protein product [Rotaria socialis]CAF3363834.1 unnamed protein product [Rotaria socialis]CAF3512040.1 unnamed protein product [Rotaria socialis]CAF3652229.1 unnamed protein product [Rotaria socialis]CAF3730272.1 unnamed protein product [Rotaria socialis]
MSFITKDKENNANGWSSDSLLELSDIAQEQLRTLERLDFSLIQKKCQQELESWHSAAVSHLGQIYSQRLADLAQVYTQDVCPESDKFKQKMIEQLKSRIMPRISKVLDDPIPDPEKVEKMQNLLCHIKSECNMMRDRQWIRVQLPDIKSLSIPIKITKTSLSNHLAEQRKDLFEDLSDDDGDNSNKKEEESPAKKKRKENAIDIIDLFTINPEPIKHYSLDTNSSTLSLSNTHILVHDSHKLILFDYHRKLTELQWNDNDYGILVDMCWMSSLSVFVILTIHSVYLYDPTKPQPNLPVKVEAIKPLDRSHVLASISSFERDIYINYHKGVHIDQYRVSSTSQWSLEKRYLKADCCETKDIGIRDARCDSQHICLSIMQQDDLKWRLDIMSRDMKRIRRGISMDSGENQHKFFSMLISLHDQRWLFVNWYTNKIWLVDQQGKTRLIKETKIKNIRNICLAPNGSYAAIRTEKPSALKLYKLE